MKETIESEWIIALQKGNQKAFQELISKYQKPVNTICYRFLLDQNEAEDIAQEVFVEVFLSVHKFRGESKISTWIYRIATSKSLDELRKRKRKKRLSSFGKLIGLDKVSAFIADTNKPDDALIETENLKQLQANLDALPVNQRIALTLSKIENYSSEEVGEVMGISATAVDSLVYRAKQNLKSRINNNR